MKIEIPIPYKTFLVNCVLQNEQELRNIIESGRTKDSKWEFNISEENADMLRDLCSEKLQVLGFDRDYKLTPEGLILEDLIDIFYIK